MQETRNTGPALELVPGPVLLERPLTARSVMLSLLLGMHPPRMPAARLVQWCELFGVAPGTARVALSRMTERGELLSDDGVYELTGRVRSRQAAQDWSLEARVNEWATSWSIAIVTREARAANDRAAFRNAMRRCHYAELREGGWARPDNLPRESAPRDLWAVIDAQCSWWAGRPDGDERALVDRLFAPKPWAERARELSDRLETVTAALAAGEHDRLADAFVTGAATLQHIRNDPLLPRELLPGGWPGTAVRDKYRTYQRAFSSAAGAWFRSTGNVER